MIRPYRRAFALVLTCLLGLAVPAGAQLAAGSLTGRVRDAQGLAVAGAAVTVRGEGWLGTTTTGRAGTFRLEQVPPGAYDVLVEQAGFAPATSRVALGIGQVRELTVDLAVAGVAVETAVTAPALDLADASATTRVTAADLATLPTPRDLFTLARAVPGVLLDRVNVAGAETGQQPGLSSKGTRSFDTTWTIDGVVVTDMAAAGSSPFYFDFDHVEEVRFTGPAAADRGPGRGHRAAPWHEPLAGWRPPGRGLRRPRGVQPAQRVAGRRPHPGQGRPYPPPA